MNHGAKRIKQYSPVIPANAGIQIRILFMTTSVRRLSLLSVVLAIALIGCNREKPETAAPEKPAASSQPAIPPAPVPGFDANRAFADIVKQVDMGSRVPNSPAHAKD